MMTRQRRWQLRKLATGRCQQCGRPRVAGSTVHCAKCRAKCRKARRDLYRQSVGIPLDAPVRVHVRGLRKVG